MWYGHSVFSHKAHQLLNCAECHANAAGSRLTNDVLVPRLDTCLKCHTAKTGVRTDCVECHGYHDHTANSKFRGSLSIDDLLRGVGR